jgi:hypothetical protein
MPTWLAEPSRSIYILLLVIAILPLLAAFFLPAPAAKRDPKQKKPSTKAILLAISALALLLLAALAICDRAIESDREQIERKLREMSDGVRERNLRKTFEHVSESFKAGMAGKSNLMQIGEQAQQAGRVEEIPIWDIKVDDVGKEDTKAKAEFRIKVKGSALAENQFLVRAFFVRDPDGQWRLQTFEVYSPTGFADRIPVPGLQ